MENLELNPAGTASKECITVQLKRDVIIRPPLRDELLKPIWAYVLEMPGDEFEITIRPIQ